MDLRPIVEVKPTLTAPDISGGIYKMTRAKR
jgi:hypothetical protein